MPTPSSSSSCSLCCLCPFWFCISLSCLFTMPTIWKFILENNKSTQMEQYKYIKLNLKTRIDVLMKIQLMWFPTILLKNLFPFALPNKTWNDLDSKVHNFYSTDDRKSSEESHGASNCWQHVNKLCWSVLGDDVKCWGVKIYSYQS